MRALIFLSLIAACGGGNGVLQPQPDLAPSSVPDSWSNYAQGFFASYCISCHKPGGQGAQQDFSMYSVVVANASTIRCGVAPAGQTQSGCGSVPAAGQFPIGNGPKPSDAERLRLIAWIDAGTPN